MPTTIFHVRKKTKIFPLLLACFHRTECCIECALRLLYLTAPICDVSEVCQVSNPITQVRCNEHRAQSTEIHFYERYCVHQLCLLTDLHIDCKRAHMRHYNNWPFLGSPNRHAVFPYQTQLSLKKKKHMLTTRIRISGGQRAGLGSFCRLIPYSKRTIEIPHNAFR